MNGNRDTGDLKALTKSLDGPFMVITTDSVADARAALARNGLGELEAMLGIDDQGLADGIASGLWTQVAS